MGTVRVEEAIKMLGIPTTREMFVTDISFQEMDGVTIRDIRAIMQHKEGMQADLYDVRCLTSGPLEDHRTLRSCGITGVPGRGFDSSCRADTLTISKKEHKETHPTGISSVAGGSPSQRATKRSRFLKRLRSGGNGRWFLPQSSAPRSARDDHPTDSEDDSDGHSPEVAHAGLFENLDPDSSQSSSPPSSSERNGGMSDPESDAGSPADDHEDDAGDVYSDEGDSDEEDEVYSTDYGSELSEP
jgi:hypothetical protein